MLEKMGIYGDSIILFAASLLMLLYLPGELKKRIARGTLEESRGEKNIVIAYVSGILLALLAIAGIIFNEVAPGQ